MSNLEKDCSAKWIGEEKRLKKLWKGLAETGLKLDQGLVAGNLGWPQTGNECCGLGPLGWALRDVGIKVAWVTVLGCHQLRNEELK